MAKHGHNTKKRPEQPPAQVELNQPARTLNASIFVRIFAGGCVHTRGDVLVSILSNMKESKILV